jgi:hypothetical protein
MLELTTPNTGLLGFLLPFEVGEFVTSLCFRIPLHLYKEVEYQTLIIKRFVFRFKTERSRLTITFKKLHFKIQIFSEFKIKV